MPPDMWTQIQIRVSGPVNAPALVYLPGLHGDWTLVGSFKAAVAAQVRFVEITYPRTVSWSLHDYAAGVLAALREAGVSEGWILAESFGSQIAWALLQTIAEQNNPAASFNPAGLIMSGGFVRYPVPWIVPIVRRLNRHAPMWALRSLCRIYELYARIRHRRAPETLQEVGQFVINRTVEEDRKAILYRYSLIEQSDFNEIARQLKMPLYQLTGFFDPVVPWFPVRRWLKQHCSSYAGSKIIFRADHNVLGTAPKQAAQHVLQWMGLQRESAPLKPIAYGRATAPPGAANRKTSRTT